MTVLSIAAGVFVGLWLFKIRWAILAVMVFLVLALAARAGCLHPQKDE
jgi:hypothetical protein